MKIGKLMKRMLFPHPAVCAVLSVCAFGLLAYGFVCLEPESAVSIASYMLSFYALVTISLRVPAIISFAARFRRENAYYRMYSSDLRLKMNVSLCAGAAFNAAYAIFQLILGMVHRSVWFYAMATYYLLLSVMRLMLLMHTKAHEPGEQPMDQWRKCRLCGVGLMFVNLALGVIILYFVFRIRIFRHHEITTIAMAAFAFLSMTMAIIGIARHGRFGSPVYSAAKAISLAAAAVSMLTLENAMLTVFGEQNSLLFKQIMLGVTGTAVLLLIQGIALQMILTAQRQLKSEPALME